MSSVAFVRVADTETFTQNLGGSAVGSITLTLPAQAKAGDLLMVVLMADVFYAEMPSSAAWAVSSGRASALNTWDQVGLHASREFRRYACLVRFPMEAGDTITITPSAAWVPLGYVATLLHFGDVLSLSSARYASVVNHADIGHQTVYSGANPDYRSNVAGISPTPPVVGAGGMSVATVGANVPTSMLAATEESDGDPLDQSQWTERIDQALTFDAAASQDGLGMGLWTRPIPADEPALGGAQAGFWPAIAEDGSNTLYSSGFVSLKPGYRLAFTITSACDSAAKRWVSIALDNGETHYSNENGEAYFTVAAGTYGYTITFSDYTTVTGSVTVSADTTVSVQITPTGGCPPTGGTSSVDPDAATDCDATGGKSTAERVIAVRGPEGATVTVDGSAAGTIDSAGVLRLSVSRAAHTVVLSLAGYTDETIHVPAKG